MTVAKGSVTSLAWKAFRGSTIPSVGASAGLYPSLTSAISLFRYLFLCLFLSTLTRELCRLRRVRAAASNRPAQYHVHSVRHRGPEPVQGHYRLRHSGPLPAFVYLPLYLSLVVNRLVRFDLLDAPRTF